MGDAIVDRPARAGFAADRGGLVRRRVSLCLAFRFAWHQLAEPNLIAGTGLPVGAFRGGEEPDFLSTRSLQQDYQLVYEPTDWQHFPKRNPIVFRWQAL
ncbi:MAG: hypothetical protein MI861_28520 [Pirellulales bacterium]|nr:hypothetical protein [Pirellulales bacterium]